MRGLYEIAINIARLHGVSIGELFSRARERHVVAARVEIWSDLRERGWSYPAIGRLFGRDGSTVYQVVVGKQRRGETGAARG